VYIAVNWWATWYPGAEPGGGGYIAQRMFREECEAAGREALDILDKSGEAGVILVGRPYNVIDKEANLDVPGKLRDYYGMNVIPIFFLPLEGIGIRDINDNMFWNYGRKIIADTYGGQGSHGVVFENSLDNGTGPCVSDQTSGIPPSNRYARRLPRGNHDQQRHQGNHLHRRIDYLRLAIQSYNHFVLKCPLYHICH
jgi:hypothetical protein